MPGDVAVLANSSRRAAETKSSQGGRLCVDGDLCDRSAFYREDEYDEAADIHVRRGGGDADGFGDAGAG